MADDVDEYVARLERERSYHDERYTHELRDGAARYYAVDSGHAAYERALGQVQAGQTVLEYGCGKGSAAFDLAARGALVTGIDISPVAIEEARAEARARGVNATFVEMDAMELQLPDASVDVICGSGVLHHVDLARAYAELARTLRPGGWAVFYEPLGTNPLINLYRRLTPKMRTIDEHPLVPADFELARLYFSTVEEERHTFLSLTAAVLRRLPGVRRLVPPLQRLDQWLFRVAPFTQRMAWVVVLRLGDARPTTP